MGSSPGGDFSRWGVIRVGVVQVGIVQWGDVLEPLSMDWIILGC